MHEPFRLGSWMVDPVGRSLSDGVVQTTISPRAMGVLIELCQAGKRTVCRDALLDAVWRDVTVSDESLTQAVAELRRVFRSSGREDQIILTIPKTGYRLLVEPTLGKCPTTSGIMAGPMISMESYCLVLQAHESLIHGDRDGLRQAARLSREAVAQSPQSAMANATHAIILAHEVLYGGAKPKQLEDALGHAEDAVALGPKASISFAAMGYVLGAIGKYEESSTAFAQCMMLDDRQGEGHYLAARTAFSAGRHQISVTLALKSAELVPDRPRPLFLAARAARHFDLRLSERISRQCLQDLQSRLDVNSDDPRSRYTVGPILALLGDDDGASQAMPATSQGNQLCGIHDAFGLATIRDENKALDALEHALDHGFRHRNWLANEPMLYDLFDNPRFQRLTRALKAA